MALVIRPAIPDERLDLVALQRRASLASEDIPRQLLDHPDLIDLDPQMIALGQVFAAERDGTIAGFATVLPHADGMELEGLFVDPALWRRGIGLALVEHVVGLARDLGAAHLHVIASTDAEAFYKAAGFVQTGTQKTELGPIALVMQKLLA